MTNAIGISSMQGKGGETMAHPFIAYNFEMWNDSELRNEAFTLPARELKKTKTTCL